ncbi:MAG: 3-deoxy-8-phosphooctulonate synthase [Terriglobia bacterium]
MPTAFTREIAVGGLRLGGSNGLFLIAGPCVIESEAHARSMAERIAAVCAEPACGMAYIFKTSYDKANRTSIQSYRGPGLREGLKVLRRIKTELKLPILTDVHDPAQVSAAAEVADILQIPAFLSRQTDLLVAAGKSGRVVNIKKGQFVSPWEMQHAIEKVASTGNKNILVTERGSSFGYHNLVVDMRSFPIMRGFGYPVVFDVTHALQLPGGEGTQSGGQREFVEPLACAAVAAGVDGLFLEVHDNPDQALSDPATQLPLAHLKPLLEKLLAIGRIARSP